MSAGRRIAPPGRPLPRLRPRVRELHAAGATAQQTILALRWLLRDAVLPWLPPVVARTLLETALFVAATEYRKAG